jgi:hypothetical protein
MPNQEVQVNTLASYSDWEDAVKQKNDLYDQIHRLTNDIAQLYSQQQSACSMAWDQGYFSACYNMQLHEIQVWSEPAFSEMVSEISETDSEISEVFPVPRQAERIIRKKLDQEELQLVANFINNILKWVVVQNNAKTIDENNAKTIDENNAKVVENNAKVVENKVKKMNETEFQLVSPKKSAKPKQIKQYIEEEEKKEDQETIIIQTPPKIKQQKPKTAKTTPQKYTTSLDDIAKWENEKLENVLEQMLCDVFLFSKKQEEIILNEKKNRQGKKSLSFEQVAKDVEQFFMVSPQWDEHTSLFETQEKIKKKMAESVPDVIETKTLLTRAAILESICSETKTAKSFRFPEEPRYENASHFFSTHPFFRKVFNEESKLDMEMLKTIKETELHESGLPSTFIHIRVPFGNLNFVSFQMPIQAEIDEHLFNSQMQGLIGENIVNFHSHFGKEVFFELMNIFGMLLENVEAFISELGQKTMCHYYFLYLFPFVETALKREETLPLEFFILILRTFKIMISGLADMVLSFMYFNALVLRIYYLQSKFLEKDTCVDIEFFLKEYAVKLKEDAELKRISDIKKRLPVAVQMMFTFLLSNVFFEPGNDSYFVKRLSSMVEFCRTGKVFSAERCAAEIHLHETYESGLKIFFEALRCYLDQKCDPQLSSIHDLLFFDAKNPLNKKLDREIVFARRNFSLLRRWLLQLQTSIKVLEYTKTMRYSLSVLDNINADTRESHILFYARYQGDYTMFGTDSAKLFLKDTEMRCMPIDYFMEHTIHTETFLFGPRAQKFSLFELKNKLTAIISK